MLVGLEKFGNMVLWNARFLRNGAGCKPDILR